MTAEEHRKMLGTSFEDVKLENLADISRIRINRELSLDERKKQYVRKTESIYGMCWRDKSKSAVHRRWHFF